SLTEYDALLSPPRLDSIREMIGNEPLHPSRLQEELLKHLKDENGPYAKALAIHNEALRLQLSGPPWRAVEEFLKEFSNIEGSAAPSRFDPRRIERCFNEIAIETTGDPEIACPGRLLLPLRTLKAAIEDESNSEIGDVALKERTEALRKTLSPLVTHMENALKRRLAIEQGRTLEEFTSSSMRAIDLARTNAPCLLTTLDKCLPLLEQKQAIASASLESERTAFEPNIAELMEWLRSPHSFQEQSERLDQLVNATDPLRLEDLQKDFRYAAIMELQSLVRGLEYPSSELKTLSKILEDAPIIDFSFEQLDSLRTQILEAIDKATPRWAKAWRTVDNAAREIFEIYKHRTG
ncbi:MAG: hypothetical protein KDK78_11145, partial [Chlamydiia bacterium]|nr:hypothetical protein [Chlamydiia bacterium]